MYICTQADVCRGVHSSIIYNHPKLERTQALVTLCLLSLMDDSGTGLLSVSGQSSSPAGLGRGLGLESER